MPADIGRGEECGIAFMGLAPSSGWLESGYDALGSMLEPVSLAQMPAGT
jgi:hypothetical protein